MFHKRLKHLFVLILAVDLTVLTMHVTAQTLSPTPGSGMGSHAVGFRQVIFTDASRDGRQSNETIWYPAVVPTNPTKLQSSVSLTVGWANAAPDVTAAPYPLILASHGYTGGPIDWAAIALSLVPQGFVVVGLDHLGDQTALTFVDRPMDVLFVLDQLAVRNQSDFGGVIDTDHVGVMGASFGAYTTLSITGARIDPALASNNAATPATNFSDADPLDIFHDLKWEALVSYRAKFSPALHSGELWPAYTDKRIMAAWMLSPCWISWFGDNGLAAATVPALIFGGTDDKICPYEADDSYAFTHLGSPDRYLLTFVHGPHVPGLENASLPFTSQLGTAFFNYYLKGQKDNARYLTADYVNSQEAKLKLGLFWGVYTGK